MLLSFVICIYICVLLNTNQVEVVLGPSSKMIFSHIIKNFIL